MKRALQASNPEPATMARRPSVQLQTARYVALLALLAISVTYQLSAMEYRFPQWFGNPDRVALPFALDAEDQPHFLVKFVQPNAFAAGLREGDTLLAINAQLATGRVVFAD